MSDRWHIHSLSSVHTGQFLKAFEITACVCRVYTGTVIKGLWLKKVVGGMTSDDDWTGEYHGVPKIGGGSVDLHICIRYYLQD